MKARLASAKARLTSKQRYVLAALADGATLWRAGHVGSHVYLTSSKSQFGGPVQNRTIAAMTFMLDVPLIEEVQDGHDVLYRITDAGKEALFGKAVRR